MMSDLHFQVISRVTPLSPSTVQLLSSHGGVGSCLASSPPASFLSFFFFSCQFSILKAAVNKDPFIIVWPHPSSAEAPWWLPKSFCQSTHHPWWRTYPLLKMSQTHSFTKYNKNEWTEMWNQQENKGIQSARAFMSSDSKDVKHL